ncbi:ATP-binding protein [Bradyrhizobium hipponense]|uniref:ATP-binding protein n=1 Tax=Bradyrhizobium hipponense TaxID=2605638 RepID=A0A5S4YLW2_9BRAD|nr:ATP-binding protein [Bradyrhizobium hipponense]TYO64477.1 ATP-binding protein [Bradyrhizobium hipponense]
MTDVNLELYPEVRALKATAFEGFGVNLQEIKRTAADLLSQIGKHGFFSEYSKHDISHIDEVLKLADWLVDDQTKKFMSDADWFLITLSIYFHDMGMLVTRDEFKLRDQSGFDVFCNEVLFSGQRAAEYKARVNELGSEERDVFLYQEFVRHNHAHRIRQWIEGTIDPTFGVSKAAIGEVQRVLANLDPTLRRDLALIAESHHLDDLDNPTKYKVVQPYGSSDAETANIQYCAIILRSADLLHMRRDRTPSVLFRVINPTDPISQREWAKQNAVRRVMPQMGLNDERIPDPKAPKDTIEVHATFTEENGFFGLTSFLAYVAKEIRKSYDWAETSKKERASKHSFIWRKIADDHIETEGFLKKTYSFDLDQHKILDLLIGHTLYNDTGVVLRELSQNGIDAVRLREAESGGAIPGRLVVRWQSEERILTVTDNGTGMTQDIIEQHLLKVGSSRYQDQKFKEAHPTFSAISRFGIGVLSTFMVSDEVEITTCSRQEDKARKISLRSVHGRYLVRLLDKARDTEASSLAPHGTRVRLKVRSTARLGSVVDIMRQWIVIPRCKVTVQIDDEAPVDVGFASAADAVADHLQQSGLSVTGDQPQYKVISRNLDGVEFAYAVRWSPAYRDWTIAHVNGRTQTLPAPCTCVEGIAVVFASPGLASRSLIAVANARGPTAPKTNVARSTLETTPERDALVSTLYELYVGHVKNELNRLVTEEKYSLTWAANNAIMLVPFGFGDSTDALLPSELRAHMKALPVYITEQDGKRVNRAFNDLVKEETFWTVDCQLVSSAEGLVRESKANATVADVITSLGDKAQALPQGTILFNMDVSSMMRDSVELEFEPIQIRTSESLRRVDIQWGARTVDQWTRIDEIIDRQYSKMATTPLDQRIRQHLDEATRSERRSRNTRLWIAAESVNFYGNDRYCGTTSYYRSFLRGNVKISHFLRQLAVGGNDIDAIRRLSIFSTILTSIIDHRDRVGMAAARLRRLKADLGEDLLQGIDQFIDALNESPGGLFDTSAWSFRDHELGD